MTEHAQDRPTPLDQEALELAALYALSALGNSEMEAVERDHQGHVAFWEEVRSLREAAAGLAEAGPRARPRRDLWPEIRARLTTPAFSDAGASSGARHSVPPQVWKSWSADVLGEGSVVAADQGAFEPTDLEGIQVRRLSVDERADRVTMLIRMQAGTSYPAHRHGGAEECFVLAGDLQVGDRSGQSIEMHAGDYQRMDGGSTHPLQSTRGGCLLLVTSSRHDELLS